MVPQLVLLYIEPSNSFLIGRKRTVNFKISARDVITADYTIIMSRTREVTGNHVKLARFVLLPVREEAKTSLPLFFVQCIIKQLLDSGFVISRIMKVSVSVFSRSRRLRLITLTSHLFILEITKASSNNFLYTCTLQGITSSPRLFPSPPGDV